MREIREIERVDEFISLIGEIAAKAGLTTIYTTGPGPRDTDFVVYLEPELVNELLRVRYIPGEKFPKKIFIDRKVRRMLEEMWELVSSPRHLVHELPACPEEGL